MKHYKCVVIGDGTVGKTSLILTYMTNSFPDYLPAVFDNYSSSAIDENMQFIPQIEDTIGQIEYKEHRITTSYSYVNIFVICFSLESPDSMQNVKDLWVPEIQQNCPTVPFILVGTKCDLSNKIPKKECEKLKKEIGAKYFIECSALRHINVKEVFDLAFEICINQDKSKCSIQ